MRAAWVEDYFPDGRAEGRVHGWKADLQSPYGRLARGVDMVDDVLDLAACHRPRGYRWRGLRGRDHCLELVRGARTAKGEALRRDEDAHVTARVHRDFTNYRLPGLLTKREAHARTGLESSSAHLARSRTGAVGAARPRWWAGGGLLGRRCHCTLSRGR